MIKTLNKVVAVVLTLAMLLSIASVPISADTLNSLNDDTNGVTIDMSAVFYDEDFTPIKSASQGDKFYMDIEFTGNPTELPVTICDITLLMGYDPAKVRADEAYGMTISPQLSTAWNGESIIIAAWADTNGIKVRGKIAEEGVIYEAVFTALTDLTENDLAKIKPLASASSVDKEGNPVSQKTAFKDLRGGLFTINWVSTLEEAPEATALKDSDFTFDLNDKEYTGSAIEPAVTSTLTAGTDYEVTYANNTEVGTATITVTGKGKYTGTITKNFTIKAKEVSGDNTNGVTIDMSAVFYDEDFTPIKSASQGDKFYMDIEFTGNPKTLPVTICDITLLMGYDPAKVRADEAYGITISPQLSTAWNGESIIIAAWADTNGIKVRGKIAEEGVIYEAVFTALTDLTENDLAKIKPLASASSVDKDGNPVSQKTAFKDLRGGLFTINWVPTLEEAPQATEIKDSDFTVKAEKTYTGEPIDADIDTALTAGTDFEVSYSANRTNVGEVTVTITGIGKYTGTVRKTFKIVEKAIAAGDFTLAETSVEYKGSKIEPKVTSALEEGTDYEVTYGNNTSVAEGGTVTIKGIGNYKDSVTLTFAITAKAILDTDFDFSAVVDTVYEGKKIEPTVSSKTLKLGTDYEVTYGNNTTVAEGGTVTIKGIGNYTDTITKTFAITAKAIEETDFTFDLTDQEHTGSAIEPKVTSNLTAGTDYDVVYSNNVEIGKNATITVTGKGNYTGTITKTFKIIDKSTLDDINLIISFTEAKENGEKITSVASGEKFWIWVDFANNFTEADKTAIAYEMLVAYDPKKVQLDDYFAGLTGPIGNLKFNDRTAFLSWADTDGIRSGMPAQVQSEGNLFVIEATAKDVLSTRDLLGITIADEAMGVAGGVTRDKKTVFHNISENVIDYLVVYTIDEGALIKAEDFVIDTSDKEYTGTPITPSVTSETLRKDIDYKVDYFYNTDAGDATIVINGFGDYVGTIQRQFRIKPKSITASDFSFDTSTRIYSGSKHEPTVTSRLPKDAYEVSYANNILANLNASIIVNGIGNYTGTITKYFTIAQKEITDVDFTFDLADKEYDKGKEIKPEVKSELKAGIDYKVAYSNNVEVGTATLVVTAEGNYKGTITKTFKIVPKTIQEIDFNFVLDNQVFTGEEIRPEVTAATGLVAGTDYKVTYANNTQRSSEEVKATITVEGLGNYTGTVVKNFNIVARAIEKADFVFDLGEKKYTGEEIKPEVTSEKLVAGTDYEVVYGENTNVGEGKITVTGKGNYTGTVTNEFAITVRQLSAADFEFDRVNQVYTGSEIRPEVKSTLKADTDYEVTYKDNVNVGPATIIVTAKGDNCKGEVRQKFAIVAKTITEADFDFELDPEVYTGSAIEGKVTPIELTTAAYDVMYIDNTNVGTATIVVVGKDNYAGRIEKTFDITPRTLIYGDFNWEKVVDAEYTGSAIEPEVTPVRLADTDYVVSYSENVNAGEATVTITAVGDNCVGTITKTFDIKPKEITADDFIVDDANKVYKGSEITPDVIAKTLASTDYEVTYANNNNASGTATITVTGKGNCTGSFTATFEIVSKEITEGDFNWENVADATYTGSAITPVVEAKTESGLAPTDYEVEYENNINVGEATVIVNGIGATYGGTIKKTFNIIVKAITDADFTINPDTYVYTGSAITPTVDTVLSGDTDFDVAYDDNVNAGEVTVTFTGKGNYTGEVTKTFTITPRTIIADDFKPIGNKVYTGSEIKPVKEKTESGLAPTDYEVVYTENTNVGTATATITGIGNCDGSVVITFTIKEKGITDADFTFDLADKVYTGSKIEPTVTSTLPTADYTVTYVNNIEVGTATIIVDGNGPNCYGQIKKEFKIVEKYAPQGGGGGGVSTYAVTAPEVAGGKITASHKKASAGQTVTITVTPDEGYVLSTLVIVDKDGKEIAATKDGANYKFVMPAGTVEVKATFTAGAAEEDGFTDVKPGAYYYDAVNWAVETGITNGMSANMFGSNFDCTRAQMVTFLWRAAGCPAPKATECDFVDLVKGSYYYDAVLWAAENGITIGTSATTFSPDDNVTRGQTVTFFWRMENKPAAEVNVEFTDVAADAYYYDAVAWAVEEEITNGVSATEFAPNDMCKREQIVTFLYRFFVK